MWSVIGFTVLCLASFTTAEHLKAKAVLRNPANGIDGVIVFEETEHGILISGNITGLKTGFHGFHVHEKGDVSDPKCTSAGPHFNPYNKTHGKNDDTERHVGDLGNIQATEGVLTTISMTDNIISFSGESNIIGRSIVIHADPDDFGRGTSEDSKKTGNSGARLACGLIEKSGAALRQSSFVLSLFFVPLLLVAKL